LTKSLNILVNLANPAHYNCNDDGVGIGVWFEKDKTLCTDVYFVMPNILVDDSDGVMQKGLVIKLKDGCVISWDGTNIWHCISMRIDPKTSQKDTPQKDTWNGYASLTYLGFTLLILLEI